MKRFFALLLTFVLVLGLTVPAFAANGENGEYNGNGYNNGYNNVNGYENGEFPTPPVWEMFERPFTDYPAQFRFGYIGEVTQTEDGNYTIEILDDDGEVVLIVWKLSGRMGTAVIDAQTGFPAEIEDHSGNEILVIYGPLYTTHEVPQTNALVIAVNLAEEFGPHPFHHTIEALEWDNGDLLMTVDNGGLVVTLNYETDLQAWLTRQVVILEEFQVGDEVLLWYGPAIGLSYPAFAVATRALRLVAAQPENGDIEYGNGYDFLAELDLEGNIVRAGINLYRVNLNAEALGFEVLWNAELRQAELHRGDTVVTLAPGFAVFYVNGETHTMSAPSLLEGGRLFAPADFFESLK